METLYITSLMTYAEIGEKFGISADAVKVRAFRNDWVAKRDAYREKLPPEQLPQKVQDQIKRERESVLTKIRFDVLVENCTDIAVAFIARELQARYKEGSRAIDALELKDLMGAVEKAQNVKYRSLGIAPPKQVVEFTRIEAPADVYREQIDDAMDEYEQLTALATVKSGNGKKSLAKQ